MTDTNATTLRNALAAAVKNYVEANGLSAKDGAALADVQLSRFYQVMRGEVGKISSDALVNMLGNFGYRMTGINGSGDGTEIVLSLDKAEKVLPEIDAPKSLTEQDRKIIDFPCPLKVVDPAQNNSDFDPDFDRVSTDE